MISLPDSLLVWSSKADLKVCPPSSCLAHQSTANPPLLLNQRPHIKHFTAPSCSCIGLWYCAVHLCLVLSEFVLKFLPHKLHFTSLGVFSLLLCWYVGVLKALRCLSHTTIFYVVPPHTNLSLRSLQPSGHSLPDTYIFFGTSLVTCLRKPAKQGNLWDSLRDHEFSGYGLLVSLLLSHQPGTSMLLPLLYQVFPKMVWIQWRSKVFSLFLKSFSKESSSLLHRGAPTTHRQQPFGGNEQISVLKDSLA